MAKSIGHLVASWAFLIGVIICIAVGLLTGLNPAYMEVAWIKIFLVIAGLLIGLFNINARESNSFLMSGLALVILGFFGMGVMSTIPVAASILLSLLTLFVPATIVVAIRNVFSMAKN